jgi:hypothetical protein
MLYLLVCFVQFSEIELINCFLKIQLLIGDFLGG